MVLIFTIYMLLKREDLRNRLLLLAGVSRLNLMTQALNEAAERISRYLVMNVLVNARLRSHLCDRPLSCCMYPMPRSGARCWRCCAWCRTPGR